MADDLRSRILDVMQACKQGNSSNVLQLLALHDNLDINCRDFEWPHNTALHHAYKQGNKWLIAHLVDRGADTNIKNVCNHTGQHWPIILNELFCIVFVG
jgi:ankyrin repeat protein